MKCTFDIFDMVYLPAKFLCRRVASSIVAAVTRPVHSVSNKQYYVPATVDEIHHNPYPEKEFRSVHEERIK